MTSFHAHQLKRERKEREYVFIEPPQPSTEPPALPVGTRVLVHRKINPVFVAGVVIGGHGDTLVVRANRGAIWTVRAEKVTVLK